MRYRFPDLLPEMGSFLEIRERAPPVPRVEGQIPQEPCADSLCSGVPRLSRQPEALVRITRTPPKVAEPQKHPGAKGPPVTLLFAITHLLEEGETTPHVDKRVPRITSGPQD